MKSIRLFAALLFTAGLALAVRAAPMAHAGIIHAGIYEGVASPAYQAATGSITIVKEAPLADPKHEFRFIEIDTPEFSLTPGSSKDFPNLTPGTYGFAEDARSFPDSSWTLTGVVCHDEEGERVYPEMFDGGDEFYFIGANIPVESGQHLTCVFTNEPRGTLTIVKEAPLADPDHEFSFFIDLGPGQGSQEFTLTHGSSIDFPNVIPAFYTVAEWSFPSGYYLTSVICQDEKGKEIYPEMFQGGDIYLFMGAMIPVEPGQRLTCVFSNQPAAALTIVKEAPLAGPNHEFQFSIDPDPAWGRGEFTLTHGRDEYYFALAPGSYSVLEDARSFPDDSWTLSSVICHDEEGTEVYPEMIDGGDKSYFMGANIPLEPYQRVTCVFTNEPTGSLTIVKDADSAKGQEFAFSGGLGDFSLPGDGAHSEDYLSPGSYTIAETVPGGWGLQDVWCHIADIPEEGADFDFDPSTNSATVRLAPGQDVVCTFFNEMATAITLPESSFVAEGRAGHVTLRWETVVELDNAGFNVYRATAPHGPWTQVNQALIAAEGDAVSGAGYRFADTPGYGVFYYQLEDVDFYGATSLHGPVTIDLRSAIRAPHFRPAPPEF